MHFALCLSFAVLAQTPMMPPPAECQADSECGLTQMGCCPSCCHTVLSAMPSKDIPGHRAQCQRMPCAAPNCATVVCPPDAVQGQVHPECQHGRCLAVSGPAPECRADTDCTTSTFAGCCGSCCPEAPHVISVEKLKNEQRQCAVMDCAALACGKVKCAPVRREPVRPVCRSGQCVAEPLGAAQCRADGDCELATPAIAACRSSACGCCPGSEVALPLDRPHIMEEPAPPPLRPQAQPQKKDDPKFGLSTGNSGSTAPPPNCSPCPPTRPSRAACRDGQCIKVPVFMTK
jgi:hypothetical protein